MAFDNDAACVYSGIRAETERKGKNIGPNDLLIAAIVIANNGNLVTGNQDEFSNIKDLRISSWIE